MMELSFVRTAGRHDRIYVRRSDGTETSWSFPGYGDELPHDLIHLVAESTFGVKDGFWSRVDAGAEVARINEQANRTGGKDKYAGFGEDLSGLYMSEAVANSLWGNHLPFEERCEAISRAFAELGVAVSADVIASKVQAARTLIEDFREKWRLLAPKGTLRVSFDPRKPEASFVSSS